MARNRQIYQGDTIYASQQIDSTGVTQHAQLRRVQSATYGYTINRQDIFQFGQAGRIDSLTLQPPDVPFSFSYYLGDGYNERALGFHVQRTGNNTEGNFASGALAGNSGQNFYITTTSEGIDINNENLTAAALSGKGVAGIGNAFITSYEISAAVGDLPTVTVSYDALNTNQDLYYCQGAITGTQPASVIPQSGVPYPQNTGVRFPLPSPGTGASIPMALRPSDFSISLGLLTGVGSTVCAPIASMDIGSANGTNLQSFSLSIPLSRSAIERLGSKFPFARTVDIPQTATLSFEGLVNEKVSRNLASMLDDTASYEITATINHPGTSTPAIRYAMKGAKLISENFSSDIGSNKSVSLEFSTTLAGPNETLNGVFVSGANNETIFS